MNGFGDIPDNSGRKLAEAARWRVRLAEADVSTTLEFDAWLRSPGNLEAWERVSRPWDYFDTVADAPEVTAARRAALNDAKRAGRRLGTLLSLPRLVRPLSALAAAVLVAAIVGSAGYWWMNRPADYRTAAGERRVITLADGSKLSLDADSEVTVYYGAHERSLHLLAGQARFDVAHDKSRPFTVVAGNQKVIATGTAFNIEMAGRRVLVTLIEGHVVVLDENGAAQGMGPAWPHRIELKAGQQLSTGPAVPPEISQANVQRVTAWTNGQLMFDDEPLSSVVERVNRYSGTRIVIADPRVGAMKISGVFNAGDATGFVEIVSHYLPVKAVTVDAHTIALQSQKKEGGTL
jgi:transmembrane sensor